MERGLLCHLVGLGSLAIKRSLGFSVGVHGANWGLLVWGAVLGSWSLLGRPFLSELSPRVYMGSVIMGIWVDLCRCCHFLTASVLTSCGVSSPRSS